MDVLFSIVTGLGLRVFLQGQPLGRLAPILLGLWEGAAVHHLSNANFVPSASDHYLAYALRVAVDLYFTANLQRTFVVLLWTLLGALASETMNPSRPRERRRRSSRSVPAARVRHYQPTLTPASQGSRSTLAPVITSTPAIRPSRPPSPPSFFLEGESETNSNSPHPRYLPSAFDGREASDSPPPKPILLPTPPATHVSDGRDVRAGPSSEHRLSTIEEHSIEGQSSIDEGSRHDSAVGLPGGHIGFTRLASYAPSYAPSASSVPPLPVPNSTIRYIQTTIDRASPAAELKLDDALSVAPLPVPNAGTIYSHEEYLSDGGDPLQTPQTRAARWEDTDNDELKTPPGHNGRELSPLVLDRLFPAFGSVLASEAPTFQPPVSAALTTTTSTTAPALITTTTTTTVSAAIGSSDAQGREVAPEAVEYSSTPVAPDAAPDPDPDHLATFPDQEPKSSYPTPDASPTTHRFGDRRQDQQDRPHDYDQQTAPCPSDNQHHGDAHHHDQQQQQHEPNLEEEAETETDAASVISSAPARAMYARAEALRDEARAAEAEGNRLRGQLDKATAQARVRDVLFLKEEIREADQRATRLHDKAARRFIMARNASKDPQTLDVHGLRKAEAIHITEQALRGAFTEGRPTVRVIVGKGLHSANGIPVLKDAVMRAMGKYGIQCGVDPKNAGVLIITLPMPAPVPVRNGRKTQKGRVS